MSMSPRLMRPRATGFSPKSISGLSAWYDASNAASITLNGSTVSQWSDLSGNGRHQVQGSASLQPNYNATGLNGKGTITTTGTQWTQASAFATSSAGSYTAFFVVKFDSIAGQPYAWQRGVVNGAHSVLVSAADTWAARRAAGNQGTIGKTLVQSTFYIVTAVFSATLSRIYVGSTVGTDNTTTVAAPTGNQVLTLFALDSGTRAGSPGFAEFIYYDAELSATQQGTVRAYLNKKWGVTL